MNTDSGKARAWTPGPWALETVSTSAGSCHKIGPFPGGVVRPDNYACVYADGIRLGIDESLPRAVELRANARLIAAAPALFEALSEMLELRKATQDGRVTEKHELDIVRDARAALAIAQEPPK